MTASQKAEFTQSTLMALVTALADQKEHNRQIEVMVLALATANGLSDVLPPPAG